MDMESLIREILILKHQLYQSESRNSELKSEIELIIIENKRLLAANQTLQARLNQLEDKLSINSSNSGLPTSKDVYRI
jgi:regulator of replication initiation timing